MTATVREQEVPDPSEPKCGKCRHAIHRHDPFGCTSRYARRACDCALDARSATAAARQRWRAAPVYPAGLTEPEVRVLRLVGAGLSRTEIGQRLHLSCETVKTHLHRAYPKLGARNAPQAMVRCFELGILTVPAAEEREGVA